MEEHQIPLPVRDMRGRCSYFNDPRGCFNGEKCHFTHDEEEMQRDAITAQCIPNLRSYKTKICRYWNDNYTCIYRDCNFAHGEGELRSIHGGRLEETGRSGSFSSYALSMSEQVGPSSNTAATATATATATAAASRIKAVGSSSNTTTAAASRIRAVGASSNTTATATESRIRAVLSTKIDWKGSSTRPPGLVKSIYSDWINDDVGDQDSRP